MKGVFEAKHERRDNVAEIKCCGWATCITQPLLQQRFQFAHVLEAQVERFKSGDGGLAEIITIKFSHRHANISLWGNTETEESAPEPTVELVTLFFFFNSQLRYLGESQLDAPLFEGAGELLELLQVAVLFPHVGAVGHGRQAGCERRRHQAGGC